MTHYYDRVGNPRHYVNNKSKKGTRPTTLKDARQLGLHPSVTDIIKQLDKPAVTMWQLQKQSDAYLSESYIKDFDNANEHKKKIDLKFKRQTTAQKDSGAALHSALEHFFKKAEIRDDNMCYLDHIQNVNKKVEEIGVFNWISEKSFFHANGFGGTCDLHYKDNEIAYIIDFKTKSNDNYNKATLYDDHYMQLAAYKYGLNCDCLKTRCFILFVNKDNAGELALHEVNDEQIERGWNMFNCLLDFYYFKTNLPR